MLCCKEIGEGSINSAAIPVRRIVEEALGANATSVVIAHNHPSGLALPSGEDIQTTLRIAKALRAVEIVLADHVIVADNDYITLRLSRRYDPNDIMLGVSALRNQNLANVFYRLKLIEAYGTGILKINESYADCTAKPQFEVTDNAFKITLPNINYTGERKAVTVTNPLKLTDKANRQEMLLRLAEKQGYIVRKDVEAELKVSQATAILLLREMIEKGLLIKEGSGKQQKYRIAE